MPFIAPTASLVGTASSKLAANANPTEVQVPLLRSEAITMADHGMDTSSATTLVAPLPAI
ncbi:hypothetical protein VTL71DRAFT_8714 [Oculimacula yallundae]|uniref:Uncharacterized protein n=1 Tax=Oculimacula yallundae TaxID=86028 RepID=A0ABR4CYG4_9HELO